MATNNKEIEQRLRAVEKRMAKLEKAAVLFEEHRQAWINMNKGLRKFKEEMDRDKRKELAREKQMEKRRKKDQALFGSIASLRSVSVDRRSR